MLLFNGNDSVETHLLERPTSEKQSEKVSERGDEA
jgi:hypothetical protein